MARGRRPSGPGLLEGLDGAPAAKERATVILQTIAGQRSVVEACAELDISPAHFHRLRGAFLQAAVSSLDPRPLGRPPAERAVDPEKEALRQQARNLRVELVAAQTRAEIALTMPHVLQLRPGKKTKKKRSRR